MLCWKLVMGQGPSEHKIIDQNLYKKCERQFELTLTLFLIFPTDELFLS